MQRAMGFILVVCLLILSVSCSQPTASEPAPRDAGSEEVALLYTVLDAVIALALEKKFYCQKGVTRKIDKYAKTISLKNFVADGIPGGLSGILSIKSIEPYTIIMNVDLKGNGRRFIIDHQVMITKQMMFSKSIVFSIDGVKYQHTYPEY